jgi:hypothetical protein
MIVDHLDQARGELRIKTKAQIDAETAEMWGARAVAAWEFYASSADSRWAFQAVEYAHEAREHAATGTPGTLDRINRELAAYGVP